ncbi:MAG TPA: PadR family transcriptional regulator [Vicinamibacterales bacterium]|jgi:PadR family transcriptional regulator|nr:PadR family transcriptional regulator [Vicinamibacterales bacterium]
MPTRPDTLQGSLPLLVLTILSRRGPLHGYAITSQIQNLSDALRVEEGSLYPSLHRMEEAGWIKARTITTEHNRRARAYEITAAGRRQLGIEEARWRSVTGAVNHVLKHA